MFDDDDTVKAQRWRDRAEEARATARNMRDQKARQVLSQIADGYDFLADQAEQYQRHRAKIERDRIARGG